MVLRLPDSWSNWNLEMLVFEERGKPEYPEKNLSEQRREPTTNSTHIWCRRWDLNPGHIGGRRALSPLRHPLLHSNFLFFFYNQYHALNITTNLPLEKCPFISSLSQFFIFFFAFFLYNIVLLASYNYSSLSLVRKLFAKNSMIAKLF